jgi:hypothetical protein
MLSLIAVARWLENLLDPISACLYTRDFFFRYYYAY